MQERGGFYGDANGPEEGHTPAQERLQRATRNIEKIDAERARLLEERRMREREIEEASAELGEIISRGHELRKRDDAGATKRP